MVFFLRTILLALFVFLLGTASFAQDTLQTSSEKELMIHMTRRGNPGQILVKMGDGLKLDLISGERVKGSITNLAADAVYLDGRKVLFSEISKIRNKRLLVISSVAIGGVTASGLVGIAAGSGLMAAGGALIYYSTSAFPFIIGVGAAFVGSWVIVYSVAVLVIAGVSALIFKRIDIERDEIRFDVRPVTSS